MCQDSVSNWTAATPRLNHQKKNPKIFVFWNWNVTMVPFVYLVF